MTKQVVLVVVGLAMLGALALLLLFQRQLARASFSFGVHPEVVVLLEASLGDQKALADLDPEREVGYRTRFEDIAGTLGRLRVLGHSRDTLEGRYQAFLLTGSLVALGVIVAAEGWRLRRRARRMARLERALSELAEGRTDVRIADRGRDVVGQIATMIERTSQVMARDRRRLAALRNLSAWQEAARRHAHEMRAPLTGLELALTRLADQLPASVGDRCSGSIENARHEAHRLHDFAQRFTTFGRLPKPVLRPLDLGRFVDEVTAAYRGAWPKLMIDAQVEPGWMVSADPELLRRVLVNLFDNASRALDGRPGRVVLTAAARDQEVLLEVADDGPGVAEEVAGVLFEPYQTTRAPGEGVGIGLAISRKTLLDHGGDLLLVPSVRGATFRLVLLAAGDGASRGRGDDSP